MKKMEIAQTIILAILCIMSLESSNSFMSVIAFAIFIELGLIRRKMK